ncbi:TRAF3-interacting protein 1 [Maniola hyperantus]|uniref:TRAF3-interacting protein 1 n=1 Tax=Aphantopus hyperantus TaxID=2795564 RepID=UPI001569FFEE|nr:TRAF3-interacting protein 1 [Maniola hyperantus]
MEKEMNSDVVKNTQVSLGKYVKRPPLTDKLLKKPPFRFLHDIITSVLKSTGFFSGLFEEEELISDNVKDRESKILFLNKIITVLSTTTGQTLSIKPSKIIAGQEPEKTNEMLQCLALALDNNLSSDEAVKLYKESVKFNASNNKKARDATSPVKKSTDPRKLNSRSSDKSIKIVKSDNNNATKVKQREIKNVKKESHPKKSSLTPKTIVAPKKVSEKVKQINDTSKLTSPDDEISQINENLELTLDQNFKSAAFDIPDDTDVTPEVNADSNNSINKEHSPLQETPRINDNTEQSSKTENNIIEDNLNTNNGDVLDLEHQENKIYESKEDKTILGNQPEGLAYPQKTETENVEKIAEKNNFNVQNIENSYETKVTDTTKYVKRPTSVRPSSSRPGAPRFREKHDSIISNAENLVSGKVNIIAEKTVNEEEDEPSIVIIDDTDTLKTTQDENADLQASSEQHGHLVQQILDAQKEFTQAAGKTEVEWHFGAQKARDVLNKEIEQIRFNVQALSRVANPLGKLLDHIQEDVEVMRQELHQWITAYEYASKELLKQKVANEEYLLPLYARIKQLDVDIAEKHYKINDLKIIIHKNASRIDKLLSSGSV